MRTRKDISGCVQPHIAKLHGYTPGFQPKEGGWAKLNTNESPYPPSPKVDLAIQAAMGESLRLYPDPRSWVLREEVAKLHGLDASNVIVGNGSDDVLNLLIRAYSESGTNVAYPKLSYSLYPVLCAIQNSTVEEIAVDRSMNLPFDAIAQSKANLLLLTTPNAPTGIGYSRSDLERVLELFDGLVVFDEAYADFAEENAVELLASHSNVVITRTLSKSYGLAGIRVGYALADGEVIDVLDRVRDSYNVNRLSQAAGLAAVSDQSYLKATVGKVKRTRDFYSDEFVKLGWFTYDSQSNFIFTEPVDSSGRKGPEVAQDLFEFLKSRKILVRYFGGHALTDSFLRISVGSEDQMLLLSETIEQWTNKE
ncbi:UNVERIFIED_CONTAM: hypothetical protein GTU68_064437 [Idotea baltica]|nr:hypothetical protein [Idotea baltica]